MRTTLVLEDGRLLLTESRTPLIGDGTAAPSNAELREDGSYELREDGSRELRED